MSFTKDQIISNIMGKSNIKAIVAISAFANESRTTCPYGKDGGGVVAQDVHTQQPYTVTVLDVQGDKCERRNIQIVVYDEGLPTEQAYYNQSTTPDSVIGVPDTVYAAISSYATSLGVKSFVITKYDPDQQYALVDAWIDTATTCSRKSYRIFKSGSSLTSREVV